MGFVESRTERPPKGRFEIIAVLESVLARYPNHVGANHYYIHAVEASPHAAWALESADRLNTLVPNAGHLVHMPSHIYARVGDNAAAIKSNAAAAEVDRNYIAATGATGMYPAMYYSHNLHFLAYAAMQAGKSDEARKAAETLAENIRTRAQGMPPGMTEGFLIYPMAVRVRFRQWADVLAMPQPDAGLLANVAFWHFARGMALASTGKITDAEGEQKAFDAAAAKIPKEQGFGFAKAVAIMQISGAVLEARIAEAHGNSSAAIVALKRAVAAQDALAYDEPPDWFFPVRESLGGALLARGQCGRSGEGFSRGFDSQSEEWAIFVWVVAEFGGTEEDERCGLGEEPVRGGLAGCGCDAERRKSVKFEFFWLRERIEKVQFIRD